ncbi:MAG: DUF1540 domain-containing protein [Bacilli bacterium]|nr:DUF1540 domain-containing protein [Bacilli bacterium]
MGKNKKGNIKCDVESCKHNNCDEGVCELDSIKVSCTCDNNECECPENTVCDSFKCNENKIEG